MQQNELIDEFLDGGKQSIEDDLKMKEEKEMCKDISIGKNQNCILMKEKVEQSPWTVMKSEEKEDVISKSMIAEHDSVVIEDERIPYEDGMQPIAQTVGEIGDGDRLMLCSDQHNRGMPKEISTGTSGSHVFETDYWCMFVGIEAHLDSVSMQVVKHRMDALRKEGIGPFIGEYVHYCEAGHDIILQKMVQKKD